LDRVVCRHSCVDCQDRGSQSADDEAKGDDEPGVIPDKIAQRLKLGEELLKDGEQGGADAFLGFIEGDRQALELALGGARLLGSLVLERVGEVAEQDVGVAPLGDDPGKLWV